MTQGGKTDITYISGEKANKLFDEVGLKYEYQEVGEGHTWYTWKINLYDEAQRLFKKQRAICHDSSINNDDTPKSLCHFRGIIVGYNEYRWYQDCKIHYVKQNKCDYGWNLQIIHN